ncbi:hypothetical protein HPP92_022699 [Vanilla planifolia]|uniref:Uncharacterized protein n=1 Tax=Vanilla planifolia TaxID=51239 RepID=A0A835PW61_VANPL|nr:hypothetical protein HPP92_022699 [Vanilla planifolia]
MRVSAIGRHESVRVDTDRLWSAQVNTGQNMPPLAHLAHIEQLPVSKILD